MAQIIWTGPALRDLQEIAEYIALDNLEAAKSVVAKIERRVTRLARFPRTGSSIPELEGSRNRQLVEPPCRVFYQIRGDEVYILHVLRFERLLRPLSLDTDESP